ncbi:hypothetical protein [Paenibacillus sp. FSL M7-1046]|uniref:hypothetical protein n=1 Tax=Paenibacillus sp. FSL M7-1046 TaxID=2975315 RepID=UPI0030F90A6A
MRTIGYVLIILFYISLLSACNSSNVNSSDPPSSKSDVVANHTNEPLSEEVKVEEKPSKDINTLIPSGWRVLIQDDEPVTTEGDLNKDGITDVAMIIEQLQPNTEEAPERSLLIAFGTNDSYLLSIIADKVILKSDEGGIWGDPFESLSIDRGSVVVSDYGGSNWRWYNKYRFRFQDNEWYLIGATMGEYFSGNATQEEADEQDYNLLTGDYIIKKTNEDGKMTTERGNRGKKQLIKLKDFNIENM